MRVKRFVADTMQQAIAQVKADFGPEAVILHTKKIRRRGLLGWFGRPKVEVIAATEGRPQNRKPSGARAAQAQFKAESAAAAELARVREELDAIRRAITDHGAERRPLSGAVDSVRRTLLEQEVQEEFVQEVLAAVEAQGTKEQTEDRDWVRSKARSVLTSGIVCADPWRLADEKRVHCLVGPTGVGKTTTIAKLAANYALLAEKRVALVTVDTYRIAAVEQLKTYAEIIGVPVDVAFTPAELKAAIDRRSDYDLILVDTAGRSQKNKMQMAELRAFLDVIDDPLIHLVISGTTRARDMFDIVERFSQFPISHLIVTKLDETSSFGILYNLCRLTGLPLSYVTNGQSVPDDIEVAESERIADIILGGRP